MNKFANFARSQLSAYLTSGGTELAVQDTSSFPDGHFTAVIWSRGFASPADDSDREIVLAHKTDGMINLERGQEGTEAKDWNTGSLVANVLTAGLLNTLSASQGIRVITGSPSELTPYDNTVIFSFDEDENQKMCTLPDTALYSGSVLTLINTGTDEGHFVILNCAEGDGIGLTLAEQTMMGGGSTLRMTAEGGIWRIIGTGFFSPNSYFRVSSSGYFNPYGSVVYADASTYALHLYVPDNPALANVPCVVIKTDNSANSVQINSTASGRQIAELKSEGECVWFMQNPMGGISLLTSGSSGSSGTAAAPLIMTGYAELPETVSAAFADSSGGYGYLNIGPAANHAGKTVTLVRTDSTASPVMLGGYGGSEIYLESKGSFVSFISSGTEWYRTA
jgi:hypothetical protein